MTEYSEKRNRSFDPIDRRVDQWLETGLNFVDGVAGNRPGKRKANRINRRSKSNLETVSRWVGDKLDWLFEDEDDWSEPWQNSQNMSMNEDQVVPSTIKRPLDAISRRKANFINSPNEEEIRLNDEDWLEESNFRVDRWERSDFNNQSINEKDEIKKTQVSRSLNKRSMPRSTRRRLNNN